MFIISNNNGKKVTAGFGTLKVASETGSVTEGPQDRGPVLSLPTINVTGETTADGSVETDQNNGTLFWVVTQSSTSPTVEQIKAGQNDTGGAADADASQAVTAEGVQNVSVTGLSAGTTYFMYFVHTNLSDLDSNIAETGTFVTQIAPVLTNASGTSTSDTTATGSVDTDQDNGTLYWVVTQFITPPTPLQIQNGQDHTGSAADASANQFVTFSGTQNISITGLVASTSYFNHFVHTNNDLLDSNVDTSNQYTTDVVESITTTGIDWGAKTKTGHGGFTLETIGTVTSYALIGSTEFTINASTGVITPLTDAPTETPITARINGDSGTDASITNTFIPNGYSIAGDSTASEYKAILQDEPLALGDRVLQRNDDFGSSSTKTNISRTVVPTGVYTGSNPVTVEPHGGAAPRNIFIEWNNTSGGNSFIEHQSDIYRAHGQGGLIHADACMSLIDCVDMTFRGIDVFTDDWTNGSGPTDLPFAFKFDGCTDILIINCNIDKCYDGVNSDSCDGVTTTTSDFTNIGNDHWKFAGTSGPCNNTMVNGCGAFNFKEFSNAAHRDIFQIAVLSVNSTGCKFICNDVYPGPVQTPKSFGAGTGGIQGFFRNAGATTTIMADVEIDGNVMILDNPNGILTDFMDDLKIRNNSILMDPVESSVGSFSKIEYRNCNTIDSENNVSGAFNDLGGNTGLTETNNQVADRAASSPTANSYDELFFNPVTLTTDAISDYALKVGGLLDTADPKIGGPGSGTTNYVTGVYTPPVSYTEQLTDWELADRMTRSSKLQQSAVDVTNGDFGLMYLSLDLGAAPAAQGQFFASGFDFFVQWETSGVIRIRVEDSVGGIIIDEPTVLTYASQRVNILVQLEKNTTSKFVVVGSVTATSTISEVSTNNPIKFDFTAWGIGANSVGSSKQSAFEFARLAYWKLGSSPPDITTSGVQDNFFDSTTKLTIDPATSITAYGTPLIDFHGNAATLNAGTDSSGENNDFTMTGTVTDVP